MSHIVDIVAVKRCVKDGQLKSFVQNGKIYLESINSGECVEIGSAPTIDPVKRGRWIINPDGYYPYCSECKQEPEGRKMTKFCPSCGAQMSNE